MSKMKCAVINDGYNFDAEAEGGETYPPMNFKFRPLTHLQRATVKQEEIEANEDEIKIAKIRAQMIVSNLVSWDAKSIDKDGKIVDCEITEETVLALNSVTFGITYCVVGDIMKRTEKERAIAEKENKKQEQDAIMENRRFLAKLSEIDKSEKN